jgi:NTE family protein
MAPKVGLALGSGAARGWAHIGVIRALREQGIVPDLICGASVGALVGAAVAAGELDKLESWARALDWKKVLGFFDVGFNGGLIKGDKLIAFWSEHFIDRGFADLAIPFACVATDLANGHEVWLREGSVADAVRASIALPGLFSPHVQGERLLVDGGLVNPVPVSLCRALGADVVIAVDLSADMVGRHLKPPHEGQGSFWRRQMGGLLGRVGGADRAKQPSLMDVLASSINIMQVRIARSRLAGEPADVMITPYLGQLGWLDYHRADEAVDEGREAVARALPALRFALGRSEP